MSRIIFSAFITILLFGCAGEQKSSSREGKGGIQIGGVFRINEVMDIRSLYPLEITEVTGFRVASQVYESMVHFDQATLEPIPGLAESWEANESATEWTFRLRKGVKFHDDACFPNGTGRELKAQDIKYCFEQLCSPSAHNQMFWLVKERLRGAADYYQAKLNGENPAQLDCIEVIDDYTVKIKLNFPFASFLRLMGHNSFYIYPKEAVEAYGDQMTNKAVGTGPFYLKIIQRDELVVLERNPNYWAMDEFGNQLPYLDAIQSTFVKDKKSELLSIKNGDLDMIFTLPIDMYGEVMGSLDETNGKEVIAFKPQVMPSLSVHYYAFQHDDELFKDVRVRKAFNLAVDRKSLVEYTLQGEGTPGIYGIVPPVFKNYPHTFIRGNQFDPDRARQLLAEAGYPNGKNFPSITLETASGGQNYEVIAQVIQQMLKENLNVNVEIKVMSMAQQSDNAESGSSSFWRTAWLADYPDPENFLCLFLGDDMASVSGSYLNTVNYHNGLYDSLYHIGIRELDEAKRYRIFSSLDQMLIDDAVIMPLYYDEFTRLIPNYVKGFAQNSIEYRDFRKVWIDERLKMNAPE